MSSHQLGSKAYVNELWKKVSKANIDRPSLARRLTKIESKLKGIETSLEETRDLLEHEKVGVTMLWKSLEDLKQSFAFE